jgi:hypothetical protein
VSAGAIVAGGGLALGSGLALAHKWELGLRTSALALLACAAVACVAVTALDAAGALHAAVQSLLMAAIALALALGLVAWRFYRDPERLPPSHDNIIVSPADGVIAYVRATERGELPVAIKKGRRMRLDELVRTPLASEEATVIGIALTFLDVHVNRAPIAGVVKAHNRYLAEEPECRLHQRAHDDDPRAGGHGGRRGADRVAARAAHCELRPRRRARRPRSAHRRHPVRLPSRPRAAGPAGPEAVGRTRRAGPGRRDDPRRARRV